MPKKRDTEIFITVGARLYVLLVSLFLEILLYSAPTLDADNRKSHILSGLC